MRSALRGLSLRVKVFFLFAGAALLIVAPALLVVADVVERQAYKSATDYLEEAGNRLASSWELGGLRLVDTAQAKATDPTLTGLWKARRFSTLRQRLEGRDRKVVMEAVDTTFVDLRGEREQKIPPEVLRGAAGRDPMVVLADSGQPLRMAVRSAPGDSLPLGWVAVWQRLSAATLKSEMPKSNAELALQVGDSIVDYTFSPDSVASDRAAARRELRRLAEAVRRQPQGAAEMHLLGSRAYMSRAFGLAGSGLSVRVVVFRPIIEERAIADRIRQSLIGVGFFALLTALALAAVVARIVARPAQALAEASVRLARGDYQAPLPRDSGDEIGQLARAFGEMRRTLAAREQRLRSAQAEMIHREKLAAMGRLVAQLSHEINNPIYNIQNCLEALERRGDPSDPNREFLTLAQEELSRMATLTRQLLDQSRPLSDAAQPVSLNTLAQRVLTLAHREIEARGIRVALDLSPRLPEVVAHPEGVQQVLANLVNNACDAMPGGGTLRIVTLADADAVEVVVEDTGTGIVESDLPHIFEAFYTTKPGVAGIGLGLFVSEGIIRGHRGRLSVESRLGAGSRFTVRLPRETLDEALAPAAEEAGDEAVAA